MNNIFIKGDLQDKWVVGIGSLNELWIFEHKEEDKKHLYSELTSDEVKLLFLKLSSEEIADLLECLLECSTILLKRLNQIRKDPDCSYKIAKTGGKGI